MAIYTVFHEESESEVEKLQFLEPGGKNTKNPGSTFLIEKILIPLKDLLTFDLRFGFLVKNCVYDQLERSGDQNVDQKIIKLH